MGNAKLVKLAAGRILLWYPSHCIEDKSIKMVWGEYPKEFNPKVHGPYDPSRYYGAKDTKFSEVKLGDFTAWLSRRKKTPNAAVQCFSRGWHRWTHHYVLPQRAGIAPLVQLVFPMILLAYYVNYEK